MAKPAGPDCNMRCRYCFYTEKEALFDEGRRHRMSEEVLEAYVQKYIEAQPTYEVNFAWQGGEPTLMGLAFFRKVVELQKKYEGQKNITNSLQTNGLMINEEWCEFLAENKFLVGLSIDGPAPIHDRYRIDRGQAPTFRKVRNALRMLKKWNVSFNTLTSVTPEVARNPLQVYEFLKNTGTVFMQFIPIVERIPDERTRSVGLQFTEPRPGAREESTEVTEWSVDPKEYGDFLVSIFDSWVRNDIGKIFVQLFDVSLAAWAGQNPPLCNFSRMCGNAMIIEHNGDVYSCDHFVYPDHRLGNIMTDPVEKIVKQPAVTNLGHLKWTGLPRQCRECDVLFICHGGCPKNRFRTTEDGELGLNYLCDGYYRFFKHVDPYMRRMVALLNQRRAPADIMYELADGRDPSFGAGKNRSDSRSPRNGNKSSTNRDDVEQTADGRGNGGAAGNAAKSAASGRRPAGKVGRNDPCPCGSGKKLKHCCGRNA